MAKLVRASLLFAVLSSAPGAGKAQSQACLTPSSQMVFIHAPSVVYGQTVGVNVYLPPCYTPDGPAAYPVIYLLHGSGADETQWPDLKVQACADALIAGGASPFVVVMPGMAYYNPIDYGEFVLRDLLPFIESHYSVERERAGRGIGGLSIGAYYALRVAFTHPEMFAAVGAYSPVVALGGKDDPLTLARLLDVKQLQGLAVDLNVGDQDSLLANTRQLAGVLQARGVHVTVSVGQGGHNRVYWRAHTGDYLAFYVHAFASGRVPAPTATTF
ncbi:MAG TPA: alpha/beta hydrolase-fold protein [Aggregatilineales bacterium]|nr:alpha/beta hydrolase-fold protein [Aggregatilineales bacterium]